MYNKFQNTISFKQNRRLKMSIGAKFSQLGNKFGELKSKSGILGSSYRTSVLYDFTIVTKAVFHIFKITNEKLQFNSVPQVHSASKSKSFEKFFNSSGGFQFPRKFKHFESLPVQINPSDIRMNYGAALLDYSRIQSGVERSLPESSDGNITPLVGKDVATAPATLEIDLDYDIYDDYEAATCGGVAHASSALQPLSLLSGDCVSLRKLCEYSCLKDYYALFEWGDIHFFGIIDNVNTQYNAFSAKGTPLKAHANVNMSEQILSTSGGLKNDPLESGCIDFTDITKVKSYQSKQNALSTVQMGITQALR